MRAGAVAPPGLHVRAGNAMGRTRDGVLDGVLACIERDGLRRTTMAAIAIRGGVAKATLYNHFRTKPDVLAALVAREVDRIGDQALELARASSGSVSGSASVAGSVEAVAAALDRAAAHIGSIPAVRRLARSEPAALGALLASDDGPGWQHARARVAEVLGADADGNSDAAAVDLVLRWLASQLTAPAPAALRSETAALLAASVRQLPAGEAPAQG